MEAISKRGSFQQWVFLKGRYFVMAALNLAHLFWIEYNVGFSLRSSKRWQHSVSSEKVIVRRMAWMLEQKLWYMSGWNFSLLKPYMPNTWDYSDSIFDNPQEMVWGRTDWVGRFWIQNGVSSGWKPLRVLDFNWERAPQACCQSSQ